MILKAVLLSSLLLSSACGQSFTSSSSANIRLTPVEIIDNDSGETQKYYWDNKMETFCEFVTVRDMQFCLPFKGRIIYSANSPCKDQDPVAGSSSYYGGYIRSDTPDEPTIYKIGNFYSPTADKYNELVNGKYCLEANIKAEKKGLWFYITKASIESFAHR